MELVAKCVEKIIVAMMAVGNMVVVEVYKVESMMDVGCRMMMETDSMDFVEGSKMVMGKVKNIGENIENFEEVADEMDSLYLLLGLVEAYTPFLVDFSK